MSTQKPIGEVTGITFGIHGSGAPLAAEATVKAINGSQFELRQKLYAATNPALPDESTRQQSLAWIGIQDALRTAIPFYGEPVEGKSHIELTSERIIQFGASSNRARHELLRAQRTITRLQRRLSALKLEGMPQTIHETTVRVGNMSETNRTTTFDTANAAGHQARPVEVHTGTLGGATVDACYAGKREESPKEYAADAVSVAAEMESNPIIKNMLRQLVRCISGMAADRR